jgi:hypothetical protein
MNEIAMKEEAQTPWYQHGWVWFVICVPTSAILFGIVMIVAANYQRDDLVVDNYYREGMGINERRGMDILAGELKVEARLDLAIQDYLSISVTEPGDLVRFSLFHVSNREKDIVISIKTDPDGNFRTSQSHIISGLSSPGIWYIEILSDAGGWRLRQRVVTPLTSLHLVAK